MQTNEQVTWSTFDINKSVRAASFGTVSQNYLGQGSDMIDWGYQYVAVPIQDGLTMTVAADVDVRAAFVQGQPLPPVDTNKPRKCNDNWPLIAVEWDLGTVTTVTSRMLTFAYDEVWSMNYFGLYLAPYWRYLYKNDTNAMLQDTTQNYQRYVSDAAVFDANLVLQLTSDGGDAYATLTALSYRQTLGATVTVWNSQLNDYWIFMKEISSDGDVSTVDVIYPASPLYMFQDPESFRRIMVPLLKYANNETDIKYNLAWAPHHLGHWPVCDLDPSKQEQVCVCVCVCVCENGCLFVLTLRNTHTHIHTHTHSHTRSLAHSLISSRKFSFFLYRCPWRRRAIC